MDEERKNTEASDDVDAANIYQNVDLFKGTDDPFGDEFEESLRTAPKIPVKRSSLSSGGSSKEVSSPTCSAGSITNSPIKEGSESIYNWPVWPPLPVKLLNRSNSQVNQRASGPPQCQRSNSQVNQRSSVPVQFERSNSDKSRHSTSSTSSGLWRNQFNFEQESDSTYCEPVFPPLPAKQRLLSQSSRNSESSCESEKRPPHSRQESYDEVKIKYNPTAVSNKESDVWQEDEFYSAPPSLIQSADRAPSLNQSADQAPSLFQSADFDPFDQEFGSPGFLDTLPSLSSISAGRHSRSSSISVDSAAPQKDRHSVISSSVDQSIYNSSAVHQPESTYSGAGSQKSSDNDQVKNMTNLEFPTTAAPSLINTTAVESGQNGGGDPHNFNPYEDITEIRKSLKNRASADTNNKVGSPPSPPPRNSIIKTDSASLPDKKPAPPPRKSSGKPEKSGKQLAEALYDRPETVENVYSEPVPHGRDVSGHLDAAGEEGQPVKSDSTNLFDRLIAEPSMETATSVALASGQLGAKPKSKTGTLDIRNTVYKWYEEAVQEVERDLSLDINHLEQNPGLPRRLKKHNYEPVYPTRVIQQPSTTLLRDFDPCFDEVAEEEDTDESEGEELDCDVDVVDASPDHVTRVKVDGGGGESRSPRRSNNTQYQLNSARNSVIKLNKQMHNVIRSDKSVNNSNHEYLNGDRELSETVVTSDKKPRAANNGGSGFEDVDELKAGLKKACNGDDFADGEDPSNEVKENGRGGFPGIKFGSPKRINFGPPKPPRHFEYSSLSSGDGSQAASKSERRDSKVKKSPKDLFGGKKKPKIVIGGDTSEEKKKDIDLENGGDTVHENLYVTLPCDRSGGGSHDRSPGSVSSGSKSRSNEQSPRSGWESDRQRYQRNRIHSETRGISEEDSSSPSPPPPLPTSPPPRATRPKQTMYENVWIERSSPDSETGRSKSLGSLNSDKKLDSEEEGSTSTSTRSPPALPPRRGSQLSVSIATKAESFGSQSSLATSGSNTSGSQNSKETASNADSKDVKAALKKLSSGRSFSVSNLKLPRLPSMAENLKKKVADQLRSATDSGTPSPHHPSDLANMSSSSILNESGVGLEDADEDDLNSSVAELSLFSGAKSLHLPEWDALTSTSGSSSSRHFTFDVFLFSSRKKQYQLKWLVLGNGSVRIFNEENVLSKPKEIIMLNNIFTISKKADKHMGPEFQELHCFNISALNSNGKLKNYTVGCISSTERNTVMEKIVQSLGTRLNNFDISDATRIGWAYMKVGFAADWSLSWLYLTSDQLGFATQQSEHFQTINLKKTKDTSVKKDVKNLEPPVGFAKHPALVIDFNDRTMYILPGAPCEVQSWKLAIEQIAFTNTNKLSDQQVTHENVPVLVDKCLKFVFSHGVMTEGIYRLAGVNTKINKLLSEFRSNAWAVEISREDYSEHDVANVLKRFVRQLEAPLLTNQLRQHFLTASRIQDEDKRKSTLKSLLGQLPDVNYATTRKLLGHLYTVSSQSEKNLMPVYNLAPLWGPNMLLVDGQVGQGFGETREETDVCADLITHYPYLFDVDMEELDKERKLVEVLEKINYPTPSTMKRSGDVMMWCYLESRTTGTCVSLTLHPSLTAGEASKQVAKEAGLNSLQGMVMHEVVMGECLERPIHHSEKLLDLTLRWGVWEDEDRRNNYLVMKHNQIYSDALPCATPPLSIFSEIQFCDNKPKSKFNKYLFSVANASITYFKEDKNGQTVESQSWPVEDIIWYIGCEKKRAPPHSLNLTFIMKHQNQVRSKETPLFGRVLSFGSRELFTKWIAALLVAEYGTDITSNELVLLE